MQVRIRRDCHCEKDRKLIRLTFRVVTLAGTQDANHNNSDDNDENGSDDRHNEIKVRDDETNCVFESELWDAVARRNCS